MIVSENTIQAVTELIKKCFEENRAFDRMVSVLGEFQNYKYVVSILKLK